ncbi:MAG: hypothetical protein M1821_005188 [Bathelium mastoideum]|nr:MAG: hypothetical protein M1821_005188 [Bathelium mastoideum]KAI9689239.1 MAG: hypothetical protein M1822_000977 [Bathelium mastoideum]
MSSSLILFFFSVACAVVSAGTTYNSTFTFYGEGDSRGDGTCNTNTAACGFFTNPGFSAAVSQNLYGAAPGAGAGPICGACWRLNATTNPYNGADIGTSIVVKVNNLCPASGNPLCAQPNLDSDSTNQFGGVVDFNLCRDDGASAALFGNSGTGLATGTAEEVDCATWNGTVTSQGSGGSGNSGQGDTGQGDSGNYDSGNYDCGNYDSGNYDGCDGNGGANGSDSNGSSGSRQGGNSQGEIGECGGDDCAGSGVIGSASRLSDFGLDWRLGGAVTFGAALFAHWMFQ